jgi:hypothetical protein
MGALFCMNTEMIRIDSCSGLVNGFYIFFEEKKYKIRVTTHVHLNSRREPMFIAKW